MALILNLDTNEAYDFFALYDHLSPLRKKIWNKIVDKCRSWTCVMPTQSTIAKWCGCSRSAVSEAFRLFKDYGWIHLQSRGWKRSKKIFISTSKQQIDVVNRNYFKEVRATYRATHTIPTYKKKTSREAAGEIAIPPYLEKLSISLDAKLKLSLVSQHIFDETKYKCENMAKSGFRPDNPERYFVGTALRMAENMGAKIEWRKYYFMKSRSL